jgi:o-succinylbenzoate---CoA ligase
MGAAAPFKMNPHSINSLTLNGVFHSKELLLERIAIEKEESELLRQLFSFLKLWLNDDTSIDLQTSGSTGPSKTITVRKQQMLNSAEMTVSYFGLKSGMNALMCLSPEYIAGRMMIVRAMLAGLNLVTTRAEANPVEVLDKSVDFAAMVPFQFATALQKTPEKLDLIKTIILGGSDLQSHLAEACSKLKCKVFHTYGMTETLSHIALRDINGKKKSKWFAPLKGIQIARDDRGCLTINAPMLNDDLIITNDIARINNAGKFQILGRADDVIISAGLKLHPRQVEKKIFSLIPDRFVVTEQTDKNAGKIMVLILEKPLSTLNVFRLWKSLSENLSDKEMPRKIIVYGKLPELDSGKTDFYTIKKNLGTI